MKREWPIQLLIGILAAAIILTGAWWLPQLSARDKTDSQAASTHMEQQAGLMVSGDYHGSVSLNRVYQGVFNIDPAATPSPMDLGQIDLSLHLDQMSNGKAGFVMLDRTLVFKREPQITVTPVGPTPGPRTPTPAPQPLDIGPYVNVTPDGATLLLVSDVFTMTLNGREIRRQFSLTSSNVQADGATLTGTYRETIWGYAAEPSTVMGSFTLQKPVFPTVVLPTPGTPMHSQRLYLPLITKP